MALTVRPSDSDSPGLHHLRLLNRQAELGRRGRHAIGIERRNEGVHKLRESLVGTGPQALGKLQQRRRRMFVTGV